MKKEEERQIKVKDAIKLLGRPALKTPNLTRCENGSSKHLKMNGRLRLILLSATLSTKSAANPLPISDMQKIVFCDNNPSGIAKEATPSLQLLRGLCMPPLEVPVMPAAGQSITPDTASFESVVYDVRDGIHGVKFRKDDGQEGWTRIKKLQFRYTRVVVVGVILTRQARGINLSCTKEVTYWKLDGTDGLRFR